MIVNLNAFFKIQYFEIFLAFIFQEKKIDPLRQRFLHITIRSSSIPPKRSQHIKSKHTQAFNNSGSSSSVVTVKQLVLAMSK